MNFVLICCVQNVESCERMLGLEVEHQKSRLFCAGRKRVELVHPLPPFRVAIGQKSDFPSASHRTDDLRVLPDGRLKVLPDG